MAKILIDSKGEKHLVGCGFLTYQTVCGDCDIADNEINGTITEGTPDCVGCIAGAQHILDVATAKEIRAWKIRGQS
jgi:hypothetical protein